MDRKTKEEVLALEGDALDLRVAWEIFRLPPPPPACFATPAGQALVLGRVREWPRPRQLLFADYLGFCLSRRLGIGKVAAELRPLYLLPEDYARAAVLAALEA